MYMKRVANLSQMEPTMIHVASVWGSLLSILSIVYTDQTRMPSAKIFWESEQIFATLDF